jgi:MFS family permease
VTVGVGLTGQAVTMIGILAATLIRDDRRFVMAIVVVEVCAGAASGIVEPPLRAVVLGFAPDAYRGVAASFLQLTQRLSATFCVAMVTGLLLGSSVATGTSLDGLRAAVSVCALLTAVGAALAWHPVLRLPGDRPPAPTTTP